jgi:hypothetical protein
MIAAMSTASPNSRAIHPNLRAVALDTSKRSQRDNDTSGFRGAMVRFSQIKPIRPGSAIQDLSQISTTYVPVGPFSAEADYKSAHAKQHARIHPVRKQRRGCRRTSKIPQL